MHWAVAAEIHCPPDTDSFLTSPGLQWPGLPSYPRTSPWGSPVVISMGNPSYYLWGPLPNAMES